MAGISPEYARRLTRRLRQIYQDSEDYVSLALIQSLSDGLDSTTWREDKQRELRLIQGRLSTRLDRDSQQAAREVKQVISKGYLDGSKSAVSEAARARRGRDRADRTEWYEQDGVAPGVVALAEDQLDWNYDDEDDDVPPPVRALVKETVASLDEVPFRILRASADVYQKVTSEVSALVLTGSTTRREASRQLLRQHLLDGVKPFVDKSGRRWEPGSYAEMAVRTATGRAAVKGHTDQLLALGQDLVIASASPEPCGLCRPWEAKVLSISGADKTGLAEGDLDQARAAGFQHPNCTHTVDIYLPGFTRRPEITGTAEGYELRQRQRAFERSIRRHKRSVAIEEGCFGKDSAEAKLARKKLRARQSEFKAWRDEHGRKNLSYRTNTRYR